MHSRHTIQGFNIAHRGQSSGQPKDLDFVAPEDMQRQGPDGSQQPSGPVAPRPRSGPYTIYGKSGSKSPGGRSDERTLVSPCTVKGQASSLTAAEVGSSVLKPTPEASVTSIAAEGARVAGGGMRPMDCPALDINSGFPSPMSVDVNMCYSRGPPPHLISSGGLRVSGAAARSPSERHAVGPAQRGYIYMDTSSLLPNPATFGKMCARFGTPVLLCAASQKERYLLSELKR